jgi:hypothetical protein
MASKIAPEGRSMLRVPSLEPQECPLNLDELLGEE